MSSRLPYATRPVEVDILGRAIFLLEVADAESLLDELIRQGEESNDPIDDIIPYWAELWPSALGMSQYLLRNNAIRAGETVLELGCGLGLPGIIAGKMGGEVTLSDHLAPALDFAEENWKLNLPDRDVQLRQLDFRRNNLKPPVDCLLASDITYDAINLPFLPDAFRQLTKPGGRVILSDPRRAVASDFFHKLPEMGFVVKKAQEIVLFDNKSIKIDIYVLELSDFQPG